jgi:hypothetical protein
MMTSSTNTVSNGNSPKGPMAAHVVKFDLPDHSFLHVTRNLLTRENDRGVEG